MTYSFIKPKQTLNFSLSVPVLQEVVKDIMALMDHASVLLRSKAVVSVLLLCR